MCTFIITLFLRNDKTQGPIILYLGQVHWIVSFLLTARIQKCPRVNQFVISNISFFSILSAERIQEKN